MPRAGAVNAYGSADRWLLIDDAVLTGTASSCRFFHWPVGFGPVDTHPAAGGEAHAKDARVVSSTVGGEARRTAAFIVSPMRAPH